MWYKSVNFGRVAAGQHHRLAPLAARAPRRCPRSASRRCAPRYPKHLIPEARIPAPDTRNTDPGTRYPKHGSCDDRVLDAPEAGPSRTRSSRIPDPETLPEPRNLESKHPDAVPEVPRAGGLPSTRKTESVIFGVVPDSLKPRSRILGTGNRKPGTSSRDPMLKHVTQTSNPGSLGSEMVTRIAKNGTSYPELELRKP